MEDLKHLEFLAVNSKEIIEKQVDSYRQQHSYAGTIIGATALYITFFLSGMDGNIYITQIVSVIPILLFIWAILLLLSIFRTKPLDQAFSTIKYQKLMDKSLKEILLFEIQANIHSYNLNVLVTERIGKHYNFAIKLVTIALISSFVLMMTNKFITIDKEPVRVKVVNSLK
ncbi:hypothetical protein [Flavobacterium sp.]|uniref:hypothetical protein n=1 Tax=Flavobacterium sp. TaxID=239 RepID=UPI002486E109|nr:hypothetical protein [Flavobacterium sp.]MDI1318174.1 hypothetical protein [Flavobacterium sp.]